MSALLRDLRLALRSAARRPGLALVMVLSLAVGIGATSAVFGVLDGVLLRPLPYGDPDSLVLAWTQFLGQGLERNGFSEPELADLQAANHVFEDFAPYTYGPRVISGLDEPVQVMAGFVGPGFFRVFGVGTVDGRAFDDDDGRPGADPVVVLRRSFSRRAFGTERVVGRRISINDTPTTVIGVVPDDFAFPTPEVGIWLPLIVDPTQPQPRGAHYLAIVARLRDGVGLEAARSDLGAVAAGMQREHPDEYPRDSGWNVIAEPLLDETVSPAVQRGLLLLMAAGVLVLLLACANAAHLLLAQAQRREQEIAVRAALGASAGDLARRFLAEGLLLAVGAGLLGLALAAGGVWSLRTLAADQIPRLGEVGLDVRVLLFTVAVSLGAGLVAVLAPLQRARRRDLQSVIRETPDAARHARLGGSLRSVLIAVEVALALLVLVGAGLLVRSFRQAQRVEVGYRAEGVLTLQLALPSSRYGEDERVVGLQRDLLSAAQGLPGVERAGLISFLPLSGFGVSGSVTPEGGDAGGGPAPEAQYRSVGGDYFAAMGIGTVEGRSFGSGDRPDSLRVAVVDRTLARELWPGESAVGKRLKRGGASSDRPWLTVVGVVGPVRDESPEDEPRYTLYRPYTQAPSRFSYLVVRAAGDLDALVPPIRRVVRRLDPALPLADVRTMVDRLHASLAAPRFAMVLLLVFAAAALLLACVGLYGILAYTTAQRTREIGIRVALGASRGFVLRAVLLRSMAMVGVGVVLGAVAAALAAPLLRSQLYQLQPTDPATFAGAIAVILGVCLLASVLPARRALRVEPARCLRDP